MIEDIKKIAYNHPEIKLDYHFNAEEVCFLTKLLRSYESELPVELNGFSASLEKSVYCNLSVEEATAFYS